MRNRLVCLFVCLFICFVTTNTVRSILCGAAAFGERLLLLPFAVSSLIALGSVRSTISREVSGPFKNSSGVVRDEQRHHYNIDFNMLSWFKARLRAIQLW